MKIYDSKSVSKYLVGAVAFGLFMGSAAIASGVINSPETGYTMCVNSKTKIISHPGTAKCPKGSTVLILGVKGEAGATGLTGAAGLNGRDGKDGKTLWNGTKDPENTWGTPGDMFINATTRTLFGPKNLDGTWPAGVPMYGPKGDPGATGPAGATGATGATGPAGATGAATSATIQYVFSRVDSPVALNAYNGVLPETTVLSVTAPANGSYLTSFYTEIYQGSSTAFGLCSILKNGVNIASQFSQNSSIKSYGNTLTLLSGDVVSLRCNGNTSGYSAFNSFGYLLKVSD